jgi:hypothetical protein
VEKPVSILEMRFFGYDRSGSLVSIGIGAGPPANVRNAPFATAPALRRKPTLCAKTGREQMQQDARLLEHLVGAAEQCERKGDAQRPAVFILMISSTLEDRRIGKSPGIPKLLQAGEIRKTGNQKKDQRNSSYKSQYEQIAPIERGFKFDRKGSAENCKGK